MGTTTINKGDSRVEFGVSHEEKELFEYAKQLSGFKTFSEFARFIIKREAQAIVQEESKILVSRRDKEVFFNALMNEDQKPKETLLAAIKLHDTLIAE